MYIQAGSRGVSPQLYRGLLEPHGGWGLSGWGWDWLKRRNQRLGGGA